MRTWIKTIFGQLSPEEQAARELHQARCSLLDAQDAKEYAEAMVERYERKIDRLRATLDVSAHEAMRFGGNE
jgi:hypothetical protein